MSFQICIEHSFYKRRRPRNLDSVCRHVHRRIIYYYINVRYSYCAHVVTAVGCRRPRYKLGINFNLALNTYCMRQSPYRRTTSARRYGFRTIIILLQSQPKRGRYARIRVTHIIITHRHYIIPRYYFNTRLTPFNTLILIICGSMFRLLFFLV